MSSPSSTCSARQSWRALLLGVSFQRLRGDSAVLKAMLIILTVVALNIALHLTEVLRQREVVPFVTEYFGLVAALLAIAVVAFDYPIA